MSAAGIAAASTLLATDVELVAAVRAGDDSAFEELYRRYHPRVGAFARRLVRDHGRAEDVTQEAFVSALRRMRRSDAPIDFKPWIFEIARNGCIDQYRRGRRAQEVSTDFDNWAAAGEPAEVRGPGAPDNSLLARERLDHLCGALDELSDTHHRIIVMRELEGLSYREIGERMELSPGAVESALFRARRRLQHEYAQLETGRRCMLMGTVIARLAEGVESGRDRRRLDRHARRCSSCRRSARQLGVEPILSRRGIASRVAALLPLPAFLRRRPFEGWNGDLQSATAGAHGAAGSLAATAGPVGFETATAAGSKAAAVIATVALAAGGGATLGGAGPLALPGKSKLDERIAERVAETQAAARPAEPPRSPLSAVAEGSQPAVDGALSALPAPAIAQPVLPVAPGSTQSEPTPVSSSAGPQPSVQPEVPITSDAPPADSIDESGATGDPAPTQEVTVVDETPPETSAAPPEEVTSAPPADPPPAEEPTPAEVIPTPAEVAPEPAEATEVPPAEPAAPPADGPSPALDAS